MYNHKEIEKKWQDFWEKNKTFKTENISKKPKFYVLDMFPYPSGAGLHVGHPEGYTANDIVARYKNANGYNVLHPMGWDAFGLPAENYAIKTGTHPKITTEKNIETFKKQIKALGFSYDWDREINTTDPEYFKWTQWIFLKMFEVGLAYEQDLPINYCPSCKTGLANEEVLSDNTCDRCGNSVEKRKIRQWVLAITKYADRLEKDVDKLDWPKGIKDMQKNWIGRSEGCEFELKKADDETKSIRVYTTRIDTVFSMAFVVIAPDHPRVFDFITDENYIECEEYIQKSNSKSDQDRTKDEKTKTGVFTGSYVINPYNNEKVPLWIGDFVLGHYGTGAVFGDAHDERDFIFAKKYSIPLKYSIAMYNKLTGNSEPREGFPTREKKCVTAIIKHPDEDKYLVECFDNGEKVFLGGGIDGEETPNDSLIREIEEESGINDFKEIKQIGIMVGHGFKARKNMNCKDPDYFYSVELNSLNGFKEIMEEDNLKFKNEWWTKEEIMSSNKLASHHKKMFETYLGGEKAFTEDGILMNSGEFDGLTSAEARIKLTEYAEKNGFGEKRVNYKLRDWLFSRQRYWGEPIPLIHLEGKDLEKLEKIEILEQSKDNNAYILTKNPTYTVIENSLSPENISKLSNFGGVKVIKTSERRGNFFSVSIPLEKENEFVEFLKNNLINKSKEEGGNWYTDSMGTSNKIIFNGKVFEIKSEKDLIEFKSYGLSVGVPEKELEVDFVKPEFGKYLVIGGKVVSKIYDGLYTKIICDYKLPLELPEVEKYEPAGDGQSPLANVENFVNIKLADNLNGKRETNTMPQWGGSCWYYLRFMDNENKDELVKSKVEKYWGQVDSYVGGAEHAVLHLLYARFWHKFLFDIGVVSHDEPFQKLRNQGLILAYAYQRANGGLVPNDEVEEKDGKFFEKANGDKVNSERRENPLEEEVKQIVSKMSKSLKNVVNPDDIINQYGADALRLYEMYMSDFKDSAPWDTRNIIGVSRFLDKVWNIFEEVRFSKENDNFTMKLLHKTIKKVGEDIEEYKFNTAIAQMMILVNNGLPKDEELQFEWKQKLLIILSPFAPHITEELWKKLGNDNSIFLSNWPKYDENLVKDDVIIIGVQVLGKLRGEIEIGVDEEQNSVLEKAKANESVAKWLEGKEIVKEIYVKGKIVNIVVK